MATPPSKPPTPNSTPDLAPDPSMEDILASIRRILNEDEAPKSAPEPEEPRGSDSGVLVLDSSMMVPETPQDAPPPQAHPQPKAILERRPEPQATLEHSPLPDPEPPPASPQPPGQPTPGSLVAPAAAAAASASVEALLRTLASERSTAVQRGGPTIEDLVRIEIRPLLKEWLDTHLPPLVERLVQAEIERVVGRMTP